MFLDVFFFFVITSSNSFWLVRAGDGVLSPFIPKDAHGMSIFGEHTFGHQNHLKSGLDQSRASFSPLGDHLILDV